MDQQELRDFTERWQLVAAREREELRSTSMERKFEQLAALMASARALGWKTTDEEEVADVRARWIRLKELLGE